MSYRSVENVPEAIPEMEGILEAVLLQALDIAREKADAGEDLVPFTALAVGETLFIETHPTEDPDDCFKEAQHTVQHATGASAYAFCYDGYIDSDQGQLDAIIAEGGVPGEPAAHAVGIIYTLEQGEDGTKVSFDDQPIYIGNAPNFMEFTLVGSDEPLAEGADEDAADPDSEDSPDDDDAARKDNDDGIDTSDEEDGEDDDRDNRDDD